MTRLASCWWIRWFHRQRELSSRKHRCQAHNCSAGCAAMPGVWSLPGEIRCPPLPLACFGLQLARQAASQHLCATRVSPIDIHRYDSEQGNLHVLVARPMQKSSSDKDATGCQAELHRPRTPALQEAPLLMRPPTAMLSRASSNHTSPTLNRERRWREGDIDFYDN